jgi:Rhodopirellula transposase DDE domain
LLLHTLNSEEAHINVEVKAAIADDQPAISVDTKKKELVGDFKNGGRELRRQGDAEAVRVHDFMIPELGKAAPYGVYDIAANEGWVSVGIDADTAAFAVQAFASRCASASKRRVESIRRWWWKLGKTRYPNATTLTITADCGGSNGARVRLWKCPFSTSRTRKIPRASMERTKGSSRRGGGGVPWTSVIRL